MKQIYFHIGFHKTGTSWLQNKVFLNTKYFNLLNDHIKPWNDIIVNYLVTTHPNDFKSDRLLQIVKPMMKRDKINIVSAERLSGHPYSGGFDTRLIAEKIHKAFPKAKIIIVTRDYNSFVISTFKQIVQRGYPGNFNDYINKNNWFFPMSSRFYFEHKNTVTLYKDLFNSKNILELDFNTFKNNKNKYFKSLSRFISVNLIVDESQQNEVINKTYSNKRIKAIRFFNKFRKTEFNQYPIINLNKKLIKLLSILFSIFYSNKNFNNKKF